MTKTRPRKNPAPGMTTRMLQSIKTAKRCSTKSAPCTRLPRSTAYGTFKKIIQRIIDKNKTLMDEGHIVWLFRYNQKIAFPLEDDARWGVPQ